MKTETNICTVIALAILCCGVLIGPVAADDGPAWWYDRSVIDTNEICADYAPVLLGQLRWVVTNAYDELEANLVGGAGSELDALVGSLISVSNYCVANVGQLKETARPFYDRLISVGYTNAYPWTVTVTDDADYAIANIGQLKNVFDFDLTPDTDADGLYDWWEIHWFGGLTNQAGADDFEADGLVNTGEYWYGTSPISADTDGDGFSDVDEIAAGTDPRDPASIPWPAISGSISYAGRQTGSIVVIAVLESGLWSTGAATSIISPGSYCITNATTGTVYWVKAWRDSDGDAVNDCFEACGVHIDNPVTFTNNLPGIDIALDDPDSDGDGMADWWEIAYFGDLSHGPSADEDGDGLTNLEEAAISTDPLSRDTDHDGIPDGMDGEPLVSVDSDADGLPDDWETFWFGNLMQAADADPDLDGVFNGGEHAAGTDPTKTNTTDTGNACALAVFSPVE